MRAGLPTIVILVVVAGAVTVLGLCVGVIDFKGTSKKTEVAATVPLPQTGNAAIRVMTANVRIAEPTDGVNVWPNRREFLVKTLLKYGPDIVGCQEVTPAQGAYLVKELGKWYEHYPRAGVGTIDGVNGKDGVLAGAMDEIFTSLNTLFYRTDRFEILDGESGLVFPDQLQKEPAENTFYTLAVLKKKPEASSKKPEELLIVVDTHLRHQEGFALKCAIRIREKIGGMLKKYPEAKVVMMGDMNRDRESKIYTAIVGEAGAQDGVGLLTDSFDYSKRTGERRGGIGMRLRDGRSGIGRRI